MSVENPSGKPGDLTFTFEQVGDAGIHWQATEESAESNYVTLVGTFRHNNKKYDVSVTFDRSKIQADLEEKITNLNAHIQNEINQIDASELSKLAGYRVKTSLDAIKSGLTNRNVEVYKEGAKLQDDAMITNLLPTIEKVTSVFRMISSRHFDRRVEEEEEEAKKIRSSSEVSETQEALSEASEEGSVEEMPSPDIELDISIEEMRDEGVTQSRAEDQDEGIEISIEAIATDEAAQRREEVKEAALREVRGLFEKGVVGKDEDSDSLKRNVEQYFKIFNEKFPDKSPSISAENLVTVLRAMGHEKLDAFEKLGAHPLMEDLEEDDLVVFKALFDQLEQ